MEVVTAVTVMHHTHLPDFALRLRPTLRWSPIMEDIVENLRVSIRHGTDEEIIKSPVWHTGIRWYLKALGKTGEVQTA